MHRIYEKRREDQRKANAAGGRTPNGAGGPRERESVPCPRTRDLGRRGTEPGKGGGPPHTLLSTTSGGGAAHRRGLRAVRHRRPPRNDPRTANRGPSPPSRPSPSPPRRRRRGRAGKGGRTPRAQSRPGATSGLRAGARSSPRNAPPSVRLSSRVSSIDGSLVARTVPGRRKAEARWLGRAAAGEPFAAHPSPERRLQPAEDPSTAGHSFDEVSR